MPEVDPTHAPDADGPATDAVHDPSEISFDSFRFDARPRALRPRARLRGDDFQTGIIRWQGHPVGSNPEYVDWLRAHSMLADARKISQQFSGQGSMWQNPFARPNPITAIETASVWFTAYPISMINKDGRSFLATLGDEDLWKAFAAIGIDGVHTGPVKEAGGINGWDKTPSIDGHFDRISTRIDPLFGTEAEFREMTDNATRYGGTIIDDIVPGHTGKGADFRLAEMGIDDYPGIYHMVEIPEKDWHLLPEVTPGLRSANLSLEQETALQQNGYIIGRLQRVIFEQPGVKETNWSATAPVEGPDGVSRRWVYLHYFKQGQPSINWLDPTFAGMRLVIGDALHSLGDLGTGGLRLDANGFLGVEKSSEDSHDSTAWSEGHPLSEAANQVIGSMVRKVGGFTFQELNLSIDDIANTSRAGADLSYDFVNRPAYHHAMATGDTEFLRMTLRLSREHGVEPHQLVHALQNHDEMTYELVHFAAQHRDDPFTFRGVTMPGSDLAELIRTELSVALTGENGPYNLVFTTNGIASTTATVIAASLGYTDISDLDEEQVDRIKRAHLLLAMFNALQPGVFALSGWDLTGAMTLEQSAVAELLETGDTRWIHRAAYDLMDYDPQASASGSGMPRGVSLYGSLPAQLADPRSFAAQLRKILNVRSRHGIATARQIDVPEVAHPGMLVMVHELEEKYSAALRAEGAAARDLVTASAAGSEEPSEDEASAEATRAVETEAVETEAVSPTLEVTVLNFAQEAIDGTVRSEEFVPGSRVIHLFTHEEIGEVDNLQSFSIHLQDHEGVALLLVPPTESPFAHSHGVAGTHDGYGQAHGRGHHHDGHHHDGHHRSH